MGQEIERKYRVDSDAWRAGAEGVVYRQGYLNREPERTVRVRIAGDRAFLTIKGRNQGATRAEFEYAIPLADAAELLRLADGPLIEKVRYRIPYAGFVWEVDEFLGDNAGLIVAEVELPDADAQPALPDWVGREVTDDPRYYNSSLSRHPFREWGGV